MSFINNLGIKLPVNDIYIKMRDYTIHVYISGCYLTYYTVLKDRTFCQRFQNRKISPNVLNEMMIKAVFTGDPSVVQHFEDCGFEVNATFYGITVLTLADFQAYEDVCKVLESRKAFRKKYNGDIFFINLIRSDFSRYQVIRMFHELIDPLPLVHRVFESGNSSSWSFGALQYASTQNSVIL